MVDWLVLFFKNPKISSFPNIPDNKTEHHTPRNMMNGIVSRLYIYNEPRLDIIEGLRRGGGKAYPTLGGL